MKILFFLSCFGSLGAGFMLCHALLLKLPYVPYERYFTNFWNSMGSALLACVPMIVYFGIGGKHALSQVFIVLATIFSGFVVRFLIEIYTKEP